jgi:hypothetical protein
MRDIVGNHVALVKEGLAGPDVVVGDSAIGAEDAVKYDPNKKLAGDSSTKESKMARNTTKAAVAKKLHARLTKAKLLAADAKLEDIYGLLDTLDKEPDPEGGANNKFDKFDLADKTDFRKSAKDMDIEGRIPEPEGNEKTAEDDEDGTEQLRAFLQGKLSDEDIEKACSMLASGPAEDEEGEEEGIGEEFEGAKPDKARKEEDVALSAKDRKRARDSKKARDGNMEPLFGGKPKTDGGSAGLVSKGAMDAAIQQATKAAIRLQQGIRAAERAVRPYVGELAMDAASPAEVYRTALKMMGRDVSRVQDTEALKVILESQPLPGSKRNAKPTVAQDAASANSYDKMFPNASRIGHA